MQLLTARSLLTACSATAAILLGSCSGGGSSAPAVATLELPSNKEVTRTSVVDMLGTAGCMPVGLTVTPDTDQIVLLDAMLGVYVLQEDRTFSRAIDNDQLREQVNAASDFTDIAGLGSNQFAITATGDGYLLDLNDRTIKQHFCYVPGFINPGQFNQHTDSVAFDKISGRIIAQPITWSLTTGVTIRAEVGTFPITGGEGDDWHSIEEREFLAGAITCDGNGILWLARGNELYRYDLATDTMTLDQSLERFGVTNVAGMTFVGDDLMLLDDTTREIVCIPTALL